MRKTLGLLCALWPCLLSYGAEVVIEGIAPPAAAAQRVRLAPAVAVPTATAAAAAPAPVASKPTDTLELQGGDMLRGTFVAIEPEAGVRWKHEAIREVISVIPAKIRAIRLQRARTTAAKAGNYRVALENGDKLGGTLVSVNDKELALETWYAGTLHIPRAALRGLTIESGRGELIYSGPTGMDGWTESGMNRGGVINDFGGALGNVIIQEALVRRVEAVAGGGEAGKSGWAFKDDAFHATSSGTLGRDVKLPPSSRIDFEAEWSGYPQFTIHFYTDALDKTYGQNAFAFMFSMRNIYLRRHTSPGSTRSMGTVVTDSPMMASGASKARISIRTDDKNKSISLYIDDVLVRKWADIGDTSKNGTGIMFYQQGNNLLKVSNLQITHWDGQADDPTAVSAAKEDLLVLKNKDKISGQLVGISNGQVEFKASFNELKIPLDRIGQVLFAGGKLADSPMPGTARLVFWDASRVTLRLDKWNDQGVDGESPLFGRATFKPAAFSSLQFTPPSDSR